MGDAKPCNNPAWCGVACGCPPTDAAAAFRPVRRVLTWYRELCLPMAPGECVPNERGRRALQNPLPAHQKTPVSTPWKTFATMCINTSTARGWRALRVAALQYAAAELAATGEAGTASARTLLDQLASADPS